MTAVVSDGFTRWLLVLATSVYSPKSALTQLPAVVGEVAQVRQAFESIGYQSAHHRELLDQDPAVTAEAVADFLAARGPRDVVAIYVTGHGEVVSGASGERLLLHTRSSRSGSARHTLSVEDLLAGVDERAPGDRPRNVLVVLDVCGAGAGLRSATDAIRTHLAAAHHEPGTARSALVLATARSEDRAQVSAFVTALRASIDMCAEVAGRGAEHLDFGALAERVQDQLADQVLESVEIGRRGGAVCFPNPRHHLAGVDPGEMSSWWEPRARGTAVTTQPGTPPSAAWRFTGRAAATAHLARWVVDAAAPPVLVVTAAPGSGKSSVLARTVALTVPDFRRAHQQAVRPDPAGVPPSEFTFAAAVWAHGAGVDELRARVLRGLGVQTWRELADLPLHDLPPVVAIDALDEAREPHDVLHQVLRPLAFAAQRGTLRLVVATRDQPVGHDAEFGAIGDGLVQPLLSTGPSQLMNLDAPQWREVGDIARYVEQVLQDPPSPGRSSVYADPVHVAVREQLARAVEQRAKHSYLLASIVASRHSRDPEPTDPSDPVWWESFPRSVGDAFHRDLEDALGHQAERALSLLRPLGIARGAGLRDERSPDRSLWSDLATAIGGGASYTDDDVAWLLRSRAATYLMQHTDDDGIPVYRFHHEALAEHAVQPLSHREAHSRAVYALLEALREHGQIDWTRAGPYLRRALPLHARDADVLSRLVVTGDGDELVETVHLLAACDPAAVAAATNGGDPPELRPLGEVLQTLRHQLPGLTVDQRTSMIAALALASARTRRTARALLTASPVPLVHGAAIHPAAPQLVLTMVTEPERLGPTALAHEMDGRAVVLTAIGNVLQIWDAVTGVLVDQLADHPDHIADVQTVNDVHGSTSIVVVAQNGSLVVWDLSARFKPVATSRGPLPRGLARAGTTATGELCVVVADGEALRTWTAPDTNVLIDALGQGAHASGMALLASPPGTAVIAVVAVFSAVVDGVELRAVDVSGARKPCSTVVPGVWNLRLVAAGEDSVIAMPMPGEPGPWSWRVGDAQPVLVDLGLDPEVSVMDLDVVSTSSGRAAVGGFSDGSVWLWQLDASAERPPATRLQRVGPPVSRVAVLDATSAGPALASVTDQDHNITTWDLDARTWLCSRANADGVAEVLLGRNRDGQPFMAVTTHAGVRVEALEAMEHGPAPDLHRGEVTAVCAVGDTVVTAGTEGAVRTWDDRGVPRDVLRVGGRTDHSPGLLPLSDAGGERRVVWWGSWGAVAIDAEHLSAPATKLTDRGVAGGAVLSPPRGPELLALLLSDGVQLREAESGRHLADLITQRPAHRVALAVTQSGGAAVAATGPDGAARFWRLDSAHRVLDHRDVAGHPGHVVAAAISPASGGQFLATGCHRGTVQVVDVITDGSPTRLLSEDGASVVDLAWLPTGRGLHLVASVRWPRAGALFAWHLPSGERVVESITPGDTVGQLAIGSVGGTPAAFALRSTGVDVLLIPAVPSAVVVPERWHLPFNPSAITVRGDRLLVGGRGGFVSIVLPGPWASPPRMP